MNPSIFSWIIDALWLVLVVYLTVSAIGVKRDTQPHLWQSLSLTLGIIIAFVLPHVPIFRFVNFAPINPAISVFGVFYPSQVWPSLFGRGTTSARTGARPSLSSKGMNWCRRVRTATFGIRCTLEVSSRASVRL
jgi:hypothetical protein